MSFTLWVPGLPIAQPRARAGVSEGKTVVYGAHSKHKIHDWKAVIRIEASRLMRGENIMLGAIVLEVIFFFPRPKRLEKSQPVLIPHTSKPDCDNLVKGIKDALTNVVWADDALVFRCGTDKYYCPRSGIPCGTLIMAELYRSLDDMQDLTKTLSGMVQKAMPF